MWWLVVVMNAIDELKGLAGLKLWHTLFAERVEVVHAATMTLPPISAVLLRHRQLLPAAEYSTAARGQRQT